MTDDNKKNKPSFFSRLFGTSDKKNASIDVKAKESKKEVEAFKGAIERLLDVISREGEDDEEGREEDEEDETFEHSIISICK